MQYYTDDIHFLENTDNKDVNFSNEDDFISSAKQEFGYKDKKEAENLLEKTAAILAGGDLSEEDNDAFFQSITEIYFDAKSKARRNMEEKCRPH